jgi:hypothetical protein
MAKLIFSSITSLDGFIEDEDGVFEWAAPDEEVLALVAEPQPGFVSGCDRHEQWLPTLSVPKMEEPW